MQVEIRPWEREPLCEALVLTQHVFPEPVEIRFWISPQCVAALPTVIRCAAPVAAPVAGTQAGTQAAQAALAQAVVRFEGACSLVPCSLVRFLKAPYETRVESSESAIPEWEFYVSPAFSVRFSRSSCAAPAQFWPHLLNDLSPRSV